VAVRRRDGAARPSATFRLESAGRAVNAFVVNHDGRYRAYVNLSPHVGTPLDLWPNEFFTDDGRALICSAPGGCRRAPADSLRSMSVGVPG
jgi:nitrite reductase/ring-hydroxylating ferredoxin subunit